jgi:hypothetical protein
MVVGGKRWVDSRPPPKSKWQYEERCGLLSNIPPCFTPSSFGHPYPTLAREGEERRGVAVKKEVSLWTAVDDTIPNGASRIPLVADQDVDRSLFTCPIGFNLVCPYPGFDPEKIDPSHPQISPIYGTSQQGALQKKSFTNSAAMVEKGYYQDYSCIGGSDADKNAHVIPESLTLNRHTCLYPCKLPGLKSVGDDDDDVNHDFPLKAPVIIDIIQPHQPTLKRILCVVHGLEEDSSNITVQKNLNDVGALYQGGIFNMYIRSKAEPTRWQAVQLKIINDDYDDGLDFTCPNQSQGIESKRKNGRTLEKKISFVPSFCEIFSYPVPVGYTPSLEPFFAPPVHMAPYPVGYNECSLPFYGKTPVVKMIPLGVNAKGTRYYSGDRGKGPQVSDSLLPKNQLAGYDTEGHPFFIPRGFSLPQPSGFTVDGIPFYDVPSIIRQQGDFALPALFMDPEAMPASEEESWEELLPLLGRKTDSLHRKYEVDFLQKFLSHVGESQPMLRKAIIQAKTRILNPFSTQFSPEGRGLASRYDLDVSDPPNVSEFLRDGFVFTHLNPSNVRVVVEPGALDFQSSRTPVTKSLALRHKAFRGDHSEKEIFIAVEPPGIFSVKDFNFQLQGEGLQEIPISFYPLAMKRATVEGFLHIFDRSGKRLTHCALTGTRKKFFKVSPVSLDLGWVLPQKKKEGFITVENLAEYQITVQLTILQTKREQTDPIAPSFFVDHGSITLRPRESQKVGITFFPLETGKVSDTLKLVGNGGEEFMVLLQGTTDTPISIYPENYEKSLYGADLLSIERTQLVKKVENLKSYGSLSQEEKTIVGQLKAAQSDFKSRRNLHTLHFDICLPPNKRSVRCLTIMNWGVNAVTCSLFAYDKLINCPRLVRIPAKSATSIEVAFNFFNVKSRGNYTSVIELSCQDFQNIPIPVNAYIGHPVYVPVWENVFFTPPYRLGESSSVSTVLVNDSQYDVSCYFEGLDDEDLKGVVFSLAQGHVNAKHKLHIGPFSLVPILFKFKPLQYGVSMREVSIKLVSPTYATVPAALNQKELLLIGICVAPRVAGLYDPSMMHPYIDALLKWLSHPRSLKANYEDIREDTDVDGILDLQKSGVYEVAFKSECFQPEVPGDFAALTPILAAQNVGKSLRRVLFFGSPCFTVEPKSKDLTSGELAKLDFYFQPPPNVGSIVTVHGFAAVLDRSQYLINAIQVVRRLSLGIMLLPFENHTEQQIVFDFGKIELSGEGNSEVTRYLMLCNPFANRYLWSIKIAPSARKMLAFEIPVLRGDLGKLETFPVPFKFKTEISGAYETKCEIFVESTTDQLARPVRLGTIILKGAAAFTALTGIPEVLDFGSTVVNHEALRKLILTNEGTQELDVMVLCRPPFEVKPKKFVIPAKAHQSIEIVFAPSEHRRVAKTMQVFANQKIICCDLSGVGGNAELIFEHFQDQPLDFGQLQDGNIAFTEILLKNRGTIPLRVHSVVSGFKNTLRLSYLGIISTNSTSIPKVVRI